MFATILISIGFLGLGPNDISVNPEKVEAIPKKIIAEVSAGEKLPRGLSANGYLVETVPITPEFARKIKQSDVSVFYRGQQIADSLYKEVQSQKLSDINKSVHQLAREIVGNERNDSVKLLRLCQWIVTHFVYDLEGPTEPHVLVEAKRTRCEGYANFLQELCRAIHLPAILVTGVADNESRPRYKINILDLMHAWNLVKINGIWRPVDVTWLDPVWPKGFEKEVILTGKERNFLPKPEVFVMSHVPEINGLKMTNLGPNSLKEFCENPVVLFQDYSLQYLGEYSNRISQNGSSLSFYFYTNQTMKVEYSASYPTSNLFISLEPGLHKITVLSPTRSSEIRFSSTDFLSVFFVNPSTSNLRMIEEQKAEATATGQHYTYEFYNYLETVIKSKKYNFHPNLKDEERNLALWKEVMDLYDGRSPLLNWYVNTKDEVGIRYYFSDKLIGGKTVYIECRVQCTREQINLTNPPKFPVSNWRFGLDANYSGAGK